MDDLLFLTVVKEALLSAVWIAGPPIVAALVVGFVVALFQAVTQIQEMTLTFVPKVVAIFIVLLLFGGAMTSRLSKETEHIYNLIADYSHVARSAP